MKRIRIQQPGGYEALRVEDGPDPQPGPGQVRVAVEACGVNYADGIIRMGLYASAKTKVEATKKIINRAGNLPTSLDEAIAYASNLAKIDNVVDVSVLEMNVGQLSDSAEKVTTSATPVAGFAGTKEGGN